MVLCFHNCRSGTRTLAITRVWCAPNYTNLQTISYSTRVATSGSFSYELLTVLIFPASLSPTTTIIVLFPCRLTCTQRFSFFGTMDRSFTIFHPSQVWVNDLSQLIVLPMCALSESLRFSELASPGRHPIKIRPADNTPQIQFRSEPGVMNSHQKPQHFLGYWLFLPPSGLLAFLIIHHLPALRWTHGQVQSSQSVSQGFWKPLMFNHYSLTFDLI